MNRIAHEKAVSQCVEEVALLWLRREHLIGEPHLSLPDFVERDCHLQARLEELVSAGELGWKACERELGWEEPGEVFPATYLALAQEGSTNRLTRVLDYAVRSYELSRPMVAALAWKPLDDILDPVEDLLTADDPRVRIIGLAAAVAHRQVPESALSDAVAHADHALHSRALRGVGEMGCLELLPCVAEQIQSGPRCCQLEAAWTCASARDCPLRLPRCSTPHGGQVSKQSEWSAPWSGPWILVTRPTTCAVWPRIPPCSGWLRSAPVRWATRP